MAIYKSDIVDINLESGSIHRSFMKHSIGTADQAADRIGIRAFRDGVPEDLSGASCYGYFRNSQGENIALTSYGTINGNEAYVTLPQACYNYEGNFTLTIKLLVSGVTSTVRIVDGVVDNTNTGSAVAPTSAVPSYSEILSQYDAMVAATVVANGAIATTFNAATVYPAGSYVINDGALYRLTADHAANVTWANTSKVAVKFGNELTDLKSALISEMDFTTGNQFIHFTDGYYVKNNEEVGQTVTLTPVAGGSNNNYAIVEASEGDVFTINATGGSAGRLWSFVDSDSKQLSRSAANLTGTNLKIVAPANASKLIMNAVGSYGLCYKGDSLYNRINALENTYTEEIDFTTNNQFMRFTGGAFIQTNGAIGSTVSLTPVKAAYDRHYCIVEASAGDVFTVNATGGGEARLWAFVDSNLKLLSNAAASATGTNLKLIAPVNAYKLIINAIGDYGMCYKGDSIANILKPIPKQILASFVKNIIKDTSVAVFNDGSKDVPADSLVIDIIATQSGSGDPSPSNIRSISGFSSANVIVSPTDDSQDGKTTNVPLGSTLYGATVDVTEGIIAKTHDAKTIGETSWSYSSSLGVFYTSSLRAKAEAIICSHLKGGDIVKSDAAIQALPDNSIRIKYSDNIIYAKYNSANGNVTTFKAALNDAVFVYPLISEVVSMIQPINIYTLYGENHIWTDAGNINTLKYCADPAYERYYVTPEMFGAIGDGNADDTAAVAEAITHGCVYFENHYLITSLVIENDTHWFGDGEIICNNGGISADGQYNIIIEGLKLTLSKTTLDSDPVIYFQRCNNVVIKNCQLYIMNYKGARIQNCTYARFIYNKGDCLGSVIEFFQTNGEIGNNYLKRFSNIDDPTLMDFHSVDFRVNERYIYFVEIHNNYISSYGNCIQCSSTYSYGDLIGGNVRFIDIHHNTLYSKNENALKFDGVRNGYVHDNTVDDCVYFVGFLGSNGISHDFVFKNNRILDFGRLVKEICCAYTSAQHYLFGDLIFENNYIQAPSHAGAVLFGETGGSSVYSDEGIRTQPFRVIFKNNRVSNVGSVFENPGTRRINNAEFIFSDNTFENISSLGSFADQSWENCSWDIERNIISMSGSSVKLLCDGDMKAVDNQFIGDDIEEIQLIGKETTIIERNEIKGESETQSFSWLSDNENVYPSVLFDSNNKSESTGVAIVLPSTPSGKNVTIWRSTYSQIE